MKKLLILAAILTAPVALPQDAQKPQDTQTVTIPFRNPSQPKKLVVDTMRGSVTVRGYDGPGSDRRGD